MASAACGGTCIQATRAPLLGTLASAPRNKLGHASSDSAGALKTSSNGPTTSSWLKMLIATQTGSVLRCSPSCGRWIRSCGGAAPATRSARDCERRPPTSRYVGARRRDHPSKLGLDVLYAAQDMAQCTQMGDEENICILTTIFIFASMAWPGLGSNI